MDHRGLTYQILSAIYQTLLLAKRTALVKKDLNQTKTFMTVLPYIEAFINLVRSITFLEPLTLATPLDLGKKRSIRRQTESIFGTNKVPRELKPLVHRWPKRDKIY